jgi:hypothetical protein
MPAMHPGIICRRLVLVFAIGYCTCLQAQSPPASVADRMLPMEVTVNGSKGGVWLFLERGGALYAPREAFDEWRLNLDPEAKVITFRGEDYRPLASVPGYRSKIDFANQSLDLNFSAEAFAATRLGLKMSPTLSITPAVPSLFLNYDVSYQRSDYRTASTLEDLGVIGEIGFSSNLGVLTSSFVGRDLTGKSLARDESRFLRLETTLTIHRPEKNLTPHGRRHRHPPWPAGIERLLWRHSLRHQFRPDTRLHPPAAAHPQRHLGRPLHRQPVCQ